MKHVERLAAGMSFANSDGKRHSREYQIPLERWPFRKLALHAVGLVFGLSALCAVLGVLAS